ncbi:MAG: pseudouridine synthase [Sphingobacteriaceae bacterium]
MPTPRPRKSREDKSVPNKGPKTDRNDRKSSFKARSANAPKRPFSTDKKSFDSEDKRSFGKDRFDSPKKPFSPRGEDSGNRRPNSFGKDRFDTPKKPFSPRGEDSGNRRPNSFGKDRFSDSPKRTFYKDREEAGEGKPRNFSKDRPFDGAKKFDSRDKKPFGSDNKRPFKRDKDELEGKRPRTSGTSFNRDKPYAERGYKKDFSPRKPAPEKLGGKGRKTPLPSSHDDGLIRLNRYIANAGICSRRKADELIAAGVVSVNGEPVSELGFRVNPAKDVIRYNGETLKREKMVYVLLNKPKDYITTTDDPQERRTVMSLVEKASKERIYPIGRLDRNTTGLLLMTNDGDLADKLSHPRNNITKIYQVELNKALSQGDLNKILFGLELEDGFIKPDEVSYVQGATKKEVGIQIHSGKNRIVRRIFEHLGYEVVKLDRVVYANLTKKDLTRGRWRYLDEKEIIQLKHLIK